jgi:hypothetical protein
MRLRDRVLRLHRVLWHVHARDGSRGQRRGAWRQAGGGRTGRVRSGIHCRERDRGKKKLFTVTESSNSEICNLDFFFFEAQLLV